MGDAVCSRSQAGDLGAWELSKAGNVAAFQVGWFICVLGAAHNHQWLAPLDVFLLGLHFWQVPNSRRALLTILWDGLRPLDDLCYCIPKFPQLACGTKNEIDCSGSHKEYS